MRRRVVAGITAAILVGTIAACDGGGGLTSGSDYSVQASLAQLPAAEPGTELMIQTADLLGATEAAGLERPEDLDGDALVDWIMPLTGIPGDDGPAPVFVPLASLFNLSRIHDHQAFADELGFSILDVDAFVEQSTPPETFAVVSGEIDESSLSPDLPEVAEGVVTAGEGEDFEADVATVTIARPVGIPLRLAQRDDMIAAAPSTDAVAAWAAGAEESLADHAELDAVAAALDDADVLSAVLVTGASFALADTLGGTASAEQIQAIEAELGELVPADPFQTVGIGWAADDGEPSIEVAYYFDSDDAADAAVSVFEAMFAEATSVISGQPLSDLITLDEAGRDGQVVVLSLSPAADQPLSTILTMLTRGDLPFVHR